MTFPECVKITNYGLALKIFQEIHGQDYTSNFSFDEWLAVVDAMDSKQTRGDVVCSWEIVKQKMVPLATTYEHWERVLWLGRHGHPPSDKLVIVRNMFSAISSMEECRKFRETSRACSENYSLLIAERAIRHAKTFADWAWIHELVYNSPGEVFNLCFSNMEATAQSFEEWLSVYEKATGLFAPQPEVRDRAFKKLAELAR